MIIEEWRPFPREIFKDKYQISDLGRVRETKTKKFVKRVPKSDYPAVILSIGKGKGEKMGSFKIHKIVAELFVKNDDPKNKIVVNHISGNKEESFSTNLEWVTRSENVQHAVDTGLIKLSKRAVIQFLNGKEIGRFDSVLAASKATDISDGAICNACSGKRPNAGGFEWKYVKENKNVQPNIDLSEYKQIVGFPNYLVNHEGKVYSFNQKKILITKNHQNTGHRIDLTYNGKRCSALLHRLVATYFVKKTNSKHNAISHIDGDYDNNHIDNLKWKFVPGVQMPDSHYDVPYYDPKTAIKISKKKKLSEPKDLLNANRRNLSKNQREKYDLLKAKMNQKQYGGSKTSSTTKNMKTSKKSTGSKTSATTKKKSVSKKLIEV
jgi:hypothetical protein